MAFDSDLLNEMSDVCEFVNRAVVKDSFGSQKVVWTVGAEFDALILQNSSVEATVAGAQLSTSFYGIKTNRDVHFESHDVFRRKSDGVLFRITDEFQNKTPGSSEIDMQLVMAEAWSIPASDEWTEPETETSSSAEGGVQGT